MTPADIKRFWSKVDRTGVGCWLWLTCKHEHGYGLFSVRRRHVLAHRVAYELCRGPVPDGLRVLHNCPDGDNPACVNPAHLWLGTQLENIADRNAKGRQARGARNGRATLTEAQAIEAITRRARGATVASIARAFGAPYPTVHAVVSGRSWKHLPRPTSL